MKMSVPVLGVVLGVSLTSCIRGESLSYSPGGDFARPPVMGGADPGLAGGDPHVAPAPTAPDPGGWDVAAPAGPSGAAGDPWADPHAVAPPPPPAGDPYASAPPAAAPPYDPTPYAAPPVAPPPAVPPPAVPPPLAPGAMAAGTSDADPLYYSFLGTSPPDLASDGAWLTPAPAPNVSSLRGQVVLLQFAFQGCESCGLLTPYLTQWHQTYASQGLVVVYVNNGLMSNEAAAREAIRDHALPFAYFHDAKGETLRQYGVRQFPTSYLIDRKGHVIWEGTALAQEAKLQDLIVETLK